MGIHTAGKDKTDVLKSEKIIHTLFLYINYQLSWRHESKHVPSRLKVEHHQPVVKATHSINTGARLVVK